MSLVKMLHRAALIAFLRPYIRRELPGWGRLYRFIGPYRHDPLWAASKIRWMRGKLHGYEMRLDISGWSNRSTYLLARFYDLPTQLALMQLLRPGDTAVDIGANEGMMSLLMARLVGPSGRVVSFEPNPGPRAVFEQNLARNGITTVDVRPCGLSDAATTLPLFVPHVNTGEGSFGAPNYASGAGTVIELPVEVGDKTLAGLTPTLVKIDVEGFEHKVVLGMLETLRASGPAIIMETSELLFAHAGTSVAAVAECMAELGYEPFRMIVRRRLGRQRLELVPVQSFSDWKDADILWLKRGTSSAGRAEALLAPDR